jgi:hypothetical protein
MSSDVLNPFLYARLVEYFHDVDVVCAGQEIDWSVEWTVDERTGDRTPTRVKQHSGEEYKIRCPECKDYRARLHINHMWGIWDQETQSRNLWLANCYNEQCYTDYDNQRWLYETLYTAPLRRRAGEEVKLIPGRVHGPLKLQQSKWPGGCIPLVQLAESFPDHPAITYLAGRGFDPGKLSRMYDVRYCPSSTFRWASNRIVIPIYQEGMLVSWQTRHIGDDVRGVPFNVARVPKFWTMPDTPKRLIAYNMEQALTHQTVVLVEGTTDVWNTGPMAMGVLGRSLSPEILHHLVRWAERTPDSLLVIALDPKQPAREIERGVEHHMVKTYLKTYETLQRRVIKFEWPNPELDPGSIDKFWFRELIKEQASRRGLKAVFSKPRVTA